jgi:glycosyltransferase involved in cell wall biosynthesis
MNSGPLVTVVIPTHNRRALLLRTLDSVMRQQIASLTIVVVDDGGTDDTPRAVEELQSSRIFMLRHNSSKGVSAARNAGLALATTPYVAFVDDDDLWAPDKLASQLAALADHSAARWSCAGALHVDSSLTVRWHARPPRSEWVTRELLERNAIPGGGSGVIVETELAREIGGFDEGISILADWDFYLRLALKSPVAVVDRPLVAYYVHADSMYHNPRGVLRELSYMETKYEQLLGSGVLVVNRGRWYVLLFRIARRAGDRGLAFQLVTKAAMTSPAAVTEGFLRRLWAALGREGSVSRVDNFAEDASWWLCRYSDPPPN